MNDTLAKLRVEAQRVKRGEASLFVLRTWFAALDSVRGTEPPEIKGCGDNSCCVVAPKGQGTNGGCRCGAFELRRAVAALKAQRRYILASQLPANPPPKAGQ